MVGGGSVFGFGDGFVFFLLYFEYLVWDEVFVGVVEVLVMVVVV